MTTIAYCATDMLAKVYIDRYFGHQHDLKMTPDSLPFEQYLFIATNQYLLVKAKVCDEIDRYLLLNVIRFQRYRSMTIAQFNRFQDIDRYLLTIQYIWKGFDRYHLLLENVYPIA